MKPDNVQRMIYFKLKELNTEVCEIVCDHIKELLKNVSCYRKFHKTETRKHRKHGQNSNVMEELSVD